MAVDTAAPRTRRALLAAGLGGLAATLATALGRPARVNAANGDPMLLGTANTESSVTVLNQTDLGEAGLSVVSAFGGNGIAVQAMAAGGEAVFARSTSTAAPTVWAQNLAASNSRPAVFATTGGGGATPGTGTTIEAIQTDPSPGRAAIRATSSGSGTTAIAADAGTGTGVAANGTTVGVRATNSAGGTALLAVSGSDSVSPAAKIGVYGYANQDVNARAVYGKSLLGTGVWGNSDTGRGVFGRSTAGTGVSAQSDTGRAVYGTTAATDKTALLGQNTNGGASGVQGFAGSGAPPIPEAQTGVQGISNLSTSANGVLGRSSVGTGVWGDTTSGLGVAGTGSAANSIGVFGSADIGLYGTGNVGLISDGPAIFTTSGKKTITSGSSTTVTVPGGLVTGSIGLAMLQSNRSGIWVRAVTTNTTNSTITIYLNTSVSSSTTIGWFVIN